MINNIKVFFTCKDIDIFAISKKKTIIYIILCILFSVSASAQGLNARFLGYIDRYKDVAMEHMRSHGVPASITLAQGLLESNAGQSYLATRGNNHFGIKCHKWAGEAVEYDDTLKHDCYRKYGSPEDSFLDHSKFLCGKRYQPLHALDSTDYKGWATGLRTYGYAEDPAYPQKLIGIIERYTLQQYDSIAMLPPVKQAHKGDAKHEKVRAEVPAPRKKAKKEAAAVPQPQPRTTKAAEPTAKQESSRESKRRTTVETEKKDAAKSSTTRRQHNQRATATGKPLSGSSDNDD